MHKRIMVNFGHDERSCPLIPTHYRSHPGIMHAYNVMYLLQGQAPAHGPTEGQAPPPPGLPGEPRVKRPAHIEGDPDDP
eukprot:5748185-Pyramimonas_sp.AAC.1